MIALDVNIVVSAFWRNAPDHQPMRAWLQDAVNDYEPVGLTDSVLGSAVRILTNPRVLLPVMALDHALTEASRLREHPGVLTLTPGVRHWEIFERLCRSVDAHGNLVTDAQQAAIAVEHGATWISKDRDFARFPGLRWRHPLSS